MGDFAMPQTDRFFAHRRRLAGAPRLDDDSVAFDDLQPLPGLSTLSRKACIATFGDDDCSPVRFAPSPGSRGSRRSLGNFTPASAGQQGSAALRISRSAPSLRSKGFKLEPLVTSPLSPDFIP